MPSPGKKKEAQSTPNLFEKQSDEFRLRQAPLAARMRPTTLEDSWGRSTSSGAGRVLRKAIDSGSLPSIVLWGPPG